MIYLLAIIAVVCSLGGTYVGYQWRDGEVAKLEAKKAKVEAELQQKTNDAIVDAANHITDMEAAFNAGQEKAKVVTRTVIQKATAMAAADKGISNPVCVASDDSVRYLSSSLAGMYTAAYPDRTVAAVPAARAPGNGDVRGDLRPPLPQPGAVGPVPDAARATGNGAQVPAAGVPAHSHPKPVPIK